MKIAIATNNKKKLKRYAPCWAASSTRCCPSRSSASTSRSKRRAPLSPKTRSSRRAPSCALRGSLRLPTTADLCATRWTALPASTRRATRATNTTRGEQRPPAQNLAGKDRSAHFCSVIALCLPDGREFTAEGRVDGAILDEERGEGGFGYDPLFFSPELGKTFAEASPEEKNSVSHRGRALRAMEAVVEAEGLQNAK